MNQASGGRDEADDTRGGGIAQVFDRHFSRFSRRPAWKTMSHALVDPSFDPGHARVVGLAALSERSRRNAHRVAAGADPAGCRRPADPARTSRDVGGSRSRTVVANRPELIAPRPSLPAME